MRPSEEAHELQAGGSCGITLRRGHYMFVFSSELILVIYYCYCAQQGARVDGTCACLVFCSYDKTEQGSTYEDSKFY